MSERDPSVDPHLLAALRHAPDRDALPPREVSARILAAARDAVRPPAAASPWRRLGAWLVQPQVGAAFATLALATLLGVMWSAREPAPSPAPEPSSVAEVAAAPAASTPIAQAAPPTALPAPAAERRVAKVERQRVEPRETRAKAAVEAVSPPAAPAEALAKVDAAPPAPAPAPATAAAPVPAAAPPAARSERALANEVGALAAGRAAPPAALSLADRAPSFDPLQGLEADGTAAWTWRVSGPGGAVGERAHGAAQQALWAALRRATQGRWQALPPGGAAAPWLVLQPGPQRMFRFWVAGDHLHLVDPQGHAWRAPVSAEQARDWQQTVGSW